VFDPLSIVSVVIGIAFLAAIGRVVWQHRENKAVFWGWIAVIAMFAAAYLYYHSRK
jgi:hypothetical protein